MNFLLRQKFILLIILTTFFLPFTFLINVNIDSKIKQPAESAAAFDQSSEEGEEETTVTTKNSVVKEEEVRERIFIKKIMKIFCEVIVWFSGCWGCLKREGSILFDGYEVGDFSDCYF